MSDVFSKKEKRTAFYYPSAGKVNAIHMWQNLTHLFSRTISGTHTSFGSTSISLMLSYVEGFQRR